jgi:hypothetical protein
MLDLRMEVATRIFALAHEFGPRFGGFEFLGRSFFLLGVDSPARGEMRKLGRGSALGTRVVLTLGLANGPMQGTI